MEASGCTLSTHTTTLPASERVERRKMRMIEICYSEIFVIDLGERVRNTDKRLYGEIAKN